MQVFQNKRELQHTCIKKDLLLQVKHGAERRKPSRKLGYLLDHAEISDKLRRMQLSGTTRAL